jgi:hypothetical protein
MRAVVGDFIPVDFIVQQATWLHFVRLHFVPSHFVRDGNPAVV